MTAIASRLPVFGFGFVGQFISEFSARREESAKIERAVNELHRLSDRELADIGIARYQIRDVVTAAHEAA